MLRKFLSSSIVVLLLISSCDSGDVIKPSGLTLTTTISTDGSGMVSVFVESKNTKYYEFYFGETLNEIPTTTDFGSISYTYQKSGTYTITVEAHSNESTFISESKTIEVGVFINIPTSGYTTPTTHSGMNLIWSDEFSGTTLDNTKWTFELGTGCPNCGWGNNELEYYKEENTSFIEGNLVIEAKAEAFGGKSYTSSRMITKGKFEFKYGRVDVRAVLPKGQGIWPAIWMLGANISSVGWPKCGEIDIMEMVGGDGKDNKVYGTAHWDNAGSYANYGGNYTLSSGIFNNEFHVFSITWDASYIRWYMDDIKYHEILTTPAGLSEFQESYFMILNVAVGGNWPGSPDGTTKFPQRMIVDYVRVFQNQ